MPRASEFGLNLTLQAGSSVSDGTTTRLVKTSTETAPDEKMPGAPTGSRRTERAYAQTAGDRIGRSEEPDSGAGNNATCKPPKLEQ